MKRALFSGLAVIAAAIFTPALSQETGATPPDEVDCKTLGATMKTQTANWSYADFEESGWRTLASKKCFFEAGGSIVGWLAAHLDTASPAEVRTLRYHAARVFAMTGRHQVAMIHLSHAHDPDQPENPAQDWNSYIDAFSAWLRRDVDDLGDAVHQLEKQPVDEDGYKPNLSAALRFVVCFDLPYASIETNPECIPDIETTPQDTDETDAPAPPTSILTIDDLRNEPQ
ncbi:MAG: hypothetical protein COA47_15145 [Robiginitomaculum sp.]|nr:MAG: hypothetical protein COA47_15145 [Robiginitomaculum sp.]